MPTRLKKFRRHRGSRTCSWGTSGQHRKSGMRGGFGRAGMMAHKKTSLLASGPHSVGKSGFKRPWITEERTVNVRDLEDMARNLSAKGEAQTEQGKVILDLKRLGYTKLLGAGSVTQPFLIKVDSSSKYALKKVETAGGAVIVGEKESRE